MRSASAGLTMVGTPASTAGASFSSMPHTGKLNALICSATPGSDVYTCRPTNVPLLADRLDVAVDEDEAVGQLALGAAAVHEEVPMPPSMSPVPSRRVAPVASESSWYAALLASRCVASAFSAAARAWNVMRLQRGAADSACVVDQRSRVESGAGNAGDRLAGRGVSDHDPSSGAVYQAPAT